MFTSLPFPVRSSPPRGKPWIVLIHGLGMSAGSWIDPCGERLAGGNLSFDLVLTDLDHPPFPGRAAARLGGFYASTPLRLLPHLYAPFWEVLAREGWGLAAWSQPAGAPVQEAVIQLTRILECLPAGERVVLIGHSRGGLIARRFLQLKLEGWRKVRGVVFLGCPHGGTRIAALAGLLEKFMPQAEKFLTGWLKPSFSAGLLSRISSLLRVYLHRTDIIELAPESPMISEMGNREDDERPPGLPYYNYAGCRTTFIRLYRREAESPEPPVFSLLDDLEKLLPQRLLVPEIRQGQGDGQVTLESAHLPWAQANRIFPVNHARLLVDGPVQKQVLQDLNEIIILYHGS